MQWVAVILAVLLASLSVVISWHLGYQRGIWDERMRVERWTRQRRGESQ